MALLVPVFQHFHDLPGGGILGVTKVKLLSTSDTLTVPLPSHQTATASVGRVLQGSAAACSVTQSAQTVTLVGTAGNEVIVCTVHNRTNSNPEA
jgi:hypothetical protein